MLHFKKSAPSTFSVKNSIHFFHKKH